MSQNRVRRWLRRRGIFTGQITRVRYFAERHDLPDVPKASELAVAGSKEFPKWLLMDCPCGYGHTLLLPLSRSLNPHWSLNVDESGVPSISPSVDRNRDQDTRCHFWLRDGKIHWA